MSDTPNTELKAKILVLGNTHVGKTCLIDCFKSGPRDTSLPTFDSTRGTYKIANLVN